MSRKVEETAARLKCDPFEILCRFAMGDWKGLGYETESKTCYTNAGIEFEQLIISCSDRLLAAKEAARYLYIQKKAVEHTTIDVTKDMTPVQKLDAMKQAVKMLELEVGASG